MEPTALASLAGSLMSLFGLLVSLFSVHLGNWLSRIQGLRTKWNLNNGSGEKELAARREVRYTLAELYTWQPLVMTIVLILFAGGVVFFFDDVMVSQAVQFPSIFPILYNGFFAVMVALQVLLLVLGYRAAQKLDKDIKVWLARRIS